MVRTASRQAGFTLIELLVTVTIVGILATVAVPMVELTVKRNKEQQLRADLRAIRTAIDDYKRAVDDGRIATVAGASGYPRSLSVLVDGVDNLKDPNKGKLYFLRRLPRDPMAADGVPDAADTWGQRSSASPPDDPQPGQDVFDVRSLARGTGLDGVPYRDW